MLSKRINEKYKAIFEQGIEERKKINEELEKKINEANASQIYKANKIAVDKALKELMSLIKKHEDEFKKQGEEDWGMANCMSKLKGDLLDILEYVKVKPMKPVSKDIEWIQQKGKDIFRKMGR